jgi:hypothetical protein
MGGRRDSLLDDAAATKFGPVIAGMNGSGIINQ